MASETPKTLTQPKCKFMPADNEKPATSPLIQSTGSQLADAVTEIIQIALEERKQSRAKDYRLKEIEDKIGELQKEAEDLKEDWMLEPRWRTELRQRVESEIEHFENRRREG